MHGTRSDAPAPPATQVWLNPAPLAKELPLAYEDYYTHQPERAESRTSRAKVAYRWLKLDYLSRKYGYGLPQVSPLQRLLGALLYLIPLRRAAVDEEVRQLKANPGGLLLDVGCGSGDWLLQMRELGWAVQGWTSTTRLSRPPVSGD